MNISAIILTTQARAGNLAPIVDSIVACSEVKEVIIIRDPPELIYARYLAAERARCEIILTQDDDCLVDVPAVLRTFADHGGQRLVAAIASTHWDTVRALAPMAMVGWGAAFSAAWVGPVFARYLDHYPFDAFLCREADRIFTTLLGALRPHLLFQVDVEHLPGAHAGMSADWASHAASRDKALTRCRAILLEEAQEGA